MVILDTNIIIDHLRRPKKTDSYLIKLVKKLPKEPLAISIITIQELYEGQSTKNEQKERDLLAVVSPLKILPYTYEIAQLAGEIARDLREAIEFADAAIAATAVVNDCEFYTLNKKDFSKIKDLELV